MLTVFPRVIDDHDRIVSLLRQIVEKYESAFDRPWPGNLPTEYRDKMIQGIVAFEIPISRIEGKYKFGQNRSAEDIDGVIDALKRSGNADNQALAQMMIAECDIKRNDESRFFKTSKFGCVCVALKYLTLLS